MEKSNAAVTNGPATNLLGVRYWELEIFRNALQLSKLSWFCWNDAKLETIRTKLHVLELVNGPVILDGCQSHDQCVNAVKDLAKPASFSITIQHELKPANG